MSHNQEATPDTSVLASPLPAPTQTSFFRPNTDTPVKLGSGVRSIADSELCPLNSFETPGGASFRSDNSVDDEIAHCMVSTPATTPTTYRARPDQPVARALETS